MTGSEKKNIKNGLSKIRISIDKIDNQILELLNDRLSYAKQVGKIKEKNESKVLDVEREKNILNRLTSLNKGPLKQKTLNHIFNEIIASSREIQNPVNVAYLGPEATFSHMAAYDYFGHSLTFVSQPNIKQIFREVEKKMCNFGIVPVENSIEGAVNHTLDMLFESNLKICAEKYLSISHDLLSKTDNLNDIKTIYSHPQPFAQCREWIQKNIPNAKLIECNSTANAAEKAANDHSLGKKSAAIASKKAAEKYDLSVIMSNIEDSPNNITRFLIIGNEKSKPTQNDKTSLMFVTAHRPGALLSVLKPLADSNINMLKLESRPIKNENWSYFFIVDIDGHIDDPKIRETIADVKDLCLYLKCLGSYPKSKYTNEINI